MDAVQQVAQCQRRFDRAELEDDRAVLDELIAGDFLSIGPRGFVLDRRQWIDRHDHFVYVKLDVTELDVRVYGDAAIIRSVQHNVGRHGGEESSHAVRVGQVWVRDDASWRLSSIQFSPLAEDAR